MARTAPVADVQHHHRALGDARPRPGAGEQRLQPRLGHRLQPRIEGRAQHQVGIAREAVGQPRQRPVGEPARPQRRRRGRADARRAPPSPGPARARPHRPSPSSTSAARATARSGEARGLRRDGALGSPASIAACHSVSRRAGTPKNSRAAASTPIGAGAEIDAVQVDLQQLVLGEAPLQPERQQRLLHLAAGGALRRQEQVLGELLGDGGAALHHRPRPPIRPGGAADADRVEAEMAPEAAVLHRQQRGGQVGRQVAQPHQLAIEVALGRQQRAIGRHQPHRGAPRRAERRFRPRHVPGEPEQRRRASRCRPRPVSTTSQRSTRRQPAVADPARREDGEGGAVRRRSMSAAPAAPAPATTPVSLRKTHAWWPAS